MNFDSFVLAASTASLGEEQAAREHADAVEFRMDLANDPVGALRTYDGELPLIVTNRAEWEGGNATDGPDRLETLQAAAEHDSVEAVDIELRTLKTETGVETAERVREHGSAVIASAHDFEGTPEATELRTLLEDATTAGDVGKVAVTATDRSETLALLSTTHELARRDRLVATMAMGEAGRHTRAVAPVYGSRIGYAPVRPERATAPGQYDLATLRSLVDRLGTRSESEA